MDTFYLDCRIGIPEKLYTKELKSKLNEAIASSIILTLANYFQTSVSVVGGLEVIALEKELQAELEKFVKHAEGAEALASMDITTRLPN